VTPTHEASQTTGATTAPVSPERRSLLEKLGLMHESDVCTLCNVRSETLWSWRKDNKGPAYVKIGREICYRVDDLMNWIASNVVEFLNAPSADTATA
jgi:predicted DNA-binding transcriptional regulator AlpA